MEESPEDRWHRERIEALKKGIATDRAALTQLEEALRTLKNADAIPAPVVLMMLQAELNRALLVGNLLYSFIRGGVHRLDRMTLLEAHSKSHRVHQLIRGITNRLSDVLENEGRDQ